MKTWAARCLQVLEYSAAGYLCIISSDILVLERCKLEKASSPRALSGALVVQMIGFSGIRGDDTTSRGAVR